MQALDRTESALARALDLADRAGRAPPRLAAAMRQAVFPGGARVRPRLCLAVAGACGDDAPALSAAMGAAVELLHCASLVHDDLPCFDNAATRRGLPTTHRAHGERLAVLAGDALIVLAYQQLAAACTAETVARLPELLRCLSEGVGMPLGIVAGQAWESEPAPDLSEYQRAKTGALFAAAAAGGALAAGRDEAGWREFGDALGSAYQIADDVRDVLLDEATLGKPSGQDEALDRPSVVRSLGHRGALRVFDQAIHQALDTLPDCPGAEALRGLVHAEAARLVPRALHARLAAA
ncbi:polyprenyl synthetase family protein [Piscinibacter sp. Jin2]|uniref:Polyprenyl synthetase family protein n=1 Tax=Aquariibacter lacus TaxID=2801332 RepID=A0A9X0XE40_9BURK|nr:polyprenyl synthetase family protein [Piscinibacter lacus]MBL0719291.1 polyprenyl synthetase family protein [Piscinibacter lacus]